ncbi:MAG: selenoprotein [Planctomycetota bacterium]|nr:MAG: selenoprotein [Planctomycetota bacterium]
MASRLLSELKKKIAGLELEPSGGGCFEVTVDGKLIYSKLETGEFPDEDEILARVSGKAVVRH